MITWGEFKTYCQNVGDNPSHANVVINFMEKVDCGELVKCDCCNEYVEESSTFKARYDDTLVCEQCRTDGN